MTDKIFTHKEKEYKVMATEIAVRDQIKLLKFLTVHVGGSVKGLRDIRDDDLGENLVKVGSSVIGSLVDNLKDLDDDEAIAWMNKLLERCTLNGAKCTLETFSGGKLSLLFDVIQFAIEVNFADFLQEKLGTIKGLIADLFQAKLSESQAEEM